ncbi:MAG: RluA family pseudouridine synthase [Candidatus Dojkabacteria bacterium]
MSKDTVGKRVDVFLYNYLKDKGYNYISRSFLQNNWGKLLQVNGKDVKPSYKLRENDVVEVNEQKVLENFELKGQDDIESQKGNINIVFEDDNLLVLKKEKGMSIHPGIGNRRDTLANYVRGYLEEKGEYDNKTSRAGVVHRLDKSVSGLVVFAKNKETQLYLQKQFQDRNVNKVYYTKISNKKLPEFLNIYLNKEQATIADELDVLEKNNFVCDSSWYEAKGYISRSSRNRIKMKFSPISSSTEKRALSYIKPVNSNELLIKIETGRMHQIRATLEYLGITIEGDTLYSLAKGGAIPEKIELCSILLNFIDIKGKSLTFRISL